MQSTRIPLRCTCGECALPFGYLVLTPTGYVIEIESRHHGITHTNVIPLATGGVNPPNAVTNENRINRNDSIAPK